MGGHQTPDHREVDLSCLRTIQLSHEDRLEPSQRHYSITDADRHAMAEQTGTQKGRRITPLTVRLPGIVVSVAAVLRDELLQHGLEILNQRALELVDEKPAGGVARIHEHHPLIDISTEHAVPHLLRNVHDLDPLLAQH